MYEEQIHKGIAWLESEQPEVDLDSVNLDSLDLVDWYRCILGQLLGGVKCKNIIDANQAWAEEHGFTLTDERDTYDKWEILTLEWARILRARRGVPESEVKA